MAAAQAGVQSARRASGLRPEPAARLAQTWACTKLRLFLICLSYISMSKKGGAP